MKGKQESMDSKLIAMKQYVCGEGVAENAGEFAHDFFPEHIIFKTLSERRLTAACLLCSSFHLSQGYSLGFKRLSA